MLLPTRMRRVEIIVPQKKFDDTMLYLREQNAIELLEVKEMIKGYGGGVTSTTVSERLYRLTTLESKTNSIITALGISSRPATNPVVVEPRVSDKEMAEIEKKVAEIEQQVTSTTSEAHALESLITYAERQLELSIEEIAKIENVNSPEGRHKLEEIVTGIFQTLKPSEIKFAGPLGEIIQAKALEDAVVKDISDNVAKILDSKRDEAAIADAITQNLGLRLKAVLRSKRLSYEATSRIEESKKRLRQLQEKLSELSNIDGEYLLVQREVVTAERAFEQAKGYCGRTESTFMIEGWMPSSRIGQTRTDLQSICAGEVIMRDWSSGHGPTRLQNPKSPIMTVFEKLTVGFGVPKRSTQRFSGSLPTRSSSASCSETWGTVLSSC